MSARAYSVLAFAVVIAAAIALPARAAVPTPVPEAPAVETARPVALVDKTYRRRASAWRVRPAYFSLVGHRHIIFLGIGF